MLCWVAAAALLGPLSRAEAGSFSANFSSAPAGASLFGSAVVTSGYLRLTNTAIFQQGSMVVANLDGTARVQSFSASFLLTIGSAGTHADGFSFNFGNLPNASFGEEGTGAGLIVRFDTYNNGPGDGANQIQVVYNNISVMFSPVRVLSFLPDVDTSVIQAVPVTISVNAAGQLTLTHNNGIDPTNVFTNLALPGWNPQPGWRFGVGARTGMFADNHRVDNLVINTTPQATPTATRTLTNTPSATATRTLTPTATSTGTPTSTATWTPTRTATATVTHTHTLTPTRTATSTGTATFTATWTPIPTATATVTHTRTLTPTRTATSTGTPTFTATWTPIPTATATLTHTRTLTPTRTATSTSTPTFTATWTPIPTATVTLTHTRTLTPTHTATSSQTQASSPTRTATPTEKATGTATATQTATRTVTLTVSPTATFSPTRTPTPRATATGTPTVTPTRAFTPPPTDTAALTLTPSPSPTPTATVERVRGCGLEGCVISGSDVPLGPLGSGLFTGDAGLDLIGGGRDAPVLVVYTGRGDGSFAPGPRQIPVPDAVGGFDDLAVADLDGDGRPDVVASNPGGTLIAVALGTADGGLELRAPIVLPAAPRRLLVADLTGDGVLDLVAVTADGIVVQRGGGDGGFAPLGTITTATPVTDLALLDADGDGVADLVTASPAADAVQVYHGDGAGGFSPGVALPVSGARAVVAADLDGDGRVDLAVATGDNRLLLLPGTADGLGVARMVTAAAVPADRLRVADIDGDGVADLVAVDGARGVARGVRGDGAGGFVPDPEVRIIAGEPVPGSTTGDFDADGADDIGLSAPEQREVVVNLSPLLCAGDCNRDQRVVINELILGVGIGLGSRPVVECHPADVDRNRQVRVNEIVTAVGRALNGCP